MEMWYLRANRRIVFEKDGLIWMYISSHEDFDVWRELCGLGSLAEFIIRTGGTIANDIMGNTVSFRGNAVIFAKDQVWWDTIELERADAILNERQFGWALKGAFLAHMSELELGAEVIRRIGKVCGKTVTDALSSEFMNNQWTPAKDTTEFLEGVVNLLGAEFGFVLESKVGSNFQYFSGAWDIHHLKTDGS